MGNRIYTAHDIQSILFPVFQSYNINKAILFGSHAKGLANENSDIDLLVDSGLKGMAFLHFLKML